MRGGMGEVVSGGSNERQKWARAEEVGIRPRVEAIHLSGGDGIPCRAAEEAGEEGGGRGGGGGSGVGQRRRAGAGGDGCDELAWEDGGSGCARDGGSGRRGWGKWTGRCGGE